MESPAYRDDKRGTTLAILPDLLSGHRAATLTARAGAATVTGPQAVLVSNNAYEMTDIAGSATGPGWMPGCSAWSR